MFRVPTQRSGGDKEFELPSGPCDVNSETVRIQLLDYCRFILTSMVIVIEHEAMNI
ncbi:hypothetical protein WN55_06238 [Dufourea novaeangliae]|uniref:Uncharacterized protein n=1 Tax=Dufourea novaeangliae TaxID=178035 RepID=A0A154PQ53_DUFNO|nr:hypothetical protein WN55_06238 [Dufourea novaeangliae]